MAFHAKYHRCLVLRQSHWHAFDDRTASTETFGQVTDEQVNLLVSHFPRIADLYPECTCLLVH